MENVEPVLLWSFTSMNELDIIRAPPPPPTLNQKGTLAFHHANFMGSKLINW